ncbi:hypothetical protein FLJC2902T_29600 [Flavobacterium limnosediminis JC2902]|uniref:Uncharacterized protein n=1 Tax=Flavobacterium limnosediminis JC2902 TaxID=1341181 RepID=V6SNE9_9FLAO|nr:hypothetical protein [Flavobacterium limnosediminis]ESU25950.1 hypothetical protein FLJC2902T_29600 [Flavobacterium limnosediminis JC2902]
MRNLGVVITDGVGYRNFILSDFITEAQKQFDNVIVFSCLPKEVYANFNLKCTIIELDVFQENFKTWFFRKAKELGHLQLHKNGNFGIIDNLNTNNSKTKTPRGYATRLLIKWSDWFHSEKWILRYNKWQQQTFKSHPITLCYKKLLREYDIDILFFTHQRPPYIAPLIYAAEQLNVKTTAFIFSWDNLASKGRMAGNFDYYLVWSDFMKQELLHFYQSVKQDKVDVVGTPQFEPYILDRYYLSKADFFQKFKLDLGKKTILFTCNDASSENDPFYLELLASFVVNKKLSKNVNIIVRTSPAEEPTRFQHIVSKYPFIIWNFPDWKLSRSNHQESWSQRIPSMEDVVNLRAMLAYSDLCINVLSTITLDSFLFDVPVINPVFGNEENGMFDDQKFLKYAHLDYVVKSGAINLAKNELEYLSAIEYCLTNPDQKIAEQKELIKLQIGKPLLNTSKRIAMTLKNWC